MHPPIVCTLGCVRLERYKTQNLRGGREGEGRRETSSMKESSLRKLRHIERKICFVFKIQDSHIIIIKRVMEEPI